jgi:plastocyanin
VTLGQKVGRRRILQIGGGTLAALAAPRLVLAHGPVAHGDAVDIGMAGTANGSHVWFDPIGLHVPAGTTVIWRNQDPGNAHTATAYPRRIPAGVHAWDSDYLLPNETYGVLLTEPGVYDYFCRPHEAAGMVGRIVVGDARTEPDLPVAAARLLPSVEEIVAKGRVHTNPVAMTAHP